MFYRLLELPEKSESFFLWGPRQVGKSSLLKHAYPNALYVDLLSSATYRRLAAKPEELREQIRASTFDLVIIDEVQKVPQLLDEVHWMMENLGQTFVLCGSSARKLKRGHANLLGGRALRRELRGITYGEAHHTIPFLQYLERGFLPKVLTSISNPHDFYEAYVGDYLREEIAAEGTVRNLPAFSEFLEKASLSDAEMVNYTTFARDVGVKSPTIKSYFSILEDTLIGAYLEGYSDKSKRRTIEMPKFYFFDVGIVNYLQRRDRLQPGTPEFGKTFENWVFNELRAFVSYRRRQTQLSYWKLASGIEVDFIIDKMRVAIEAKASGRIHADHLKALRSISAEYPSLEKRVVVSMEDTPRLTDDDIQIETPLSFTQKLWTGQIV